MGLRTDDHDRDRTGMRYVYPVVSRRARGVSLGINLNPNNACNFRCVYCQVPDLTRGKAPEIERPLFEAELRRMLDELVHGDYLKREAPEGLRRLNDLAFSGNGEPTSAADFDELVLLVRELMREYGLAAETKLILITNGSLIHQPVVRAGLKALAEVRGEVWFKLDCASDAELVATNGWAGGLERLRKNLALSAGLCPTWLQTCVFERGGEAPSEASLERWLAFVRARLEEGAPLAGVLLYGLARPPLLPEGTELARLPASWLEACAERIRDLGLPVEVSP